MSATSFSARIEPSISIVIRVWPELCSVACTLNAKPRWHRVGAAAPLTVRVTQKERFEMTVSNQTASKLTLVDRESAPAPDDQHNKTSGEVRLLERDDFDRDVWCVLGAPIDMADIPAAVTTIEAAVRDGERLSFVTPNVNWLVRMLDDAESRRQIIDADLSLADGAPIVAAAKMIGAPIRSRAAGSDLFEALRQRSAIGRKLKVFFFGGRDGSAQASYDAVNADRGGMEAVGWLNPGFGSVEDMSSEQIIDEINAAEPDFIVVALGAAKGQAWIDRNLYRLNAATIAHLGAVVDFTAGAVERAPSWVAKAGLEWLWRIKSDPALWKRYATDGISLLKVMATRGRLFLGAKIDQTISMDAKATVSRTVNGSRIRLSGDLLNSGLKEVRAAFREAAKAGADVELDLTDAMQIDHAFLGLVLMLEKHVSRADGQIVIVNASKEASRLFSANQMPYRFVTETENTAGEEVPSGLSAVS